MSRNYASVLLDGMAAAAAASAKEAAAAAKAAALAAKQQTQGWAPQIGGRPREGRERHVPYQCNPALAEPFPVEWYTTALGAIRTRVGDDVVRLTTAPFASTPEPEWHKFFARGFAGFGAGTDSQSNRAGYIALAVALEEMLKLPTMGMVGAYDSLLAHQEDGRCDYCQA
jgi:hypothetical protein